MSTLAIYLISLSFLITASFVVLRVYVRRDYLQRGHLTSGTAVLQALIFFTFGGFSIIYLPGDWPISHVFPILRVTGLTCMTIGLAVIFIGMFRLGILRSLGLQTGVMKNTDFYRVTRNPQVLGCFLYVVAFIILWPSWYALGWGLSLMAVIHVMVLTEEEHLRSTFRQDYEQYCNFVPRYLGYPKNQDRK